jgi:hypothetical protein
LVLQFFFFASPILPLAASIPISIVFGIISVTVVYFAYQTIQVDPMDVHLACHLRKQQTQQQQNNNNDNNDHHHNDEHNGVVGDDDNANNLPTENMKQCWICDTQVAEHSMHCKFCNKCVSHFDHHCMCKYISCVVPNRTLLKNAAHAAFLSFTHPSIQG